MHENARFREFVNGVYNLQTYKDPPNLANNYVSTGWIMYINKRICVDDVYKLTCMCVCAKERLMHKNEHIYIYMNTCACACGLLCVFMSVCVDVCVNIYTCKSCAQINRQIYVLTKGEGENV